MSDASRETNFAPPVGDFVMPAFRHRPGNHCGSTALRNLLAHHGIELSEEMAFGLGAGACFYYVVLDGQSPSRFINGRVGRLEEQFLELTGAPLRLETFPDADAPWEGAREALGAPEVSVRIGLGQGDGTAIVWASDLSPEYVRVNSEYST